MSNRPSSTRANKSLCGAVKVAQLAGLISRRQMAGAGVTTVHSASCVSASQPAQPELQKLRSQQQNFPFHEEPLERKAPPSPVLV